MRYNTQGKRRTRAEGLHLCGIGALRQFVYFSTRVLSFSLALLVRELPISANELSIISAFASYSNVPIQRVKISESRKYCFVQLKSIEDANYMLSTFNRSVPYIDNCMVIITFSRLSLNKILLTESVNAIKHQAGISASQVKSGKLLNTTEDSV